MTSLVYSMLNTISRIKICEDDSKQIQTTGLDFVPRFYDNICQGLGKLFIFIQIITY